MTSEPSSMAPYSYLLREAADIADQRAAEYGDVVKNFADIRDICDTSFDLKLSTEDVAKVMVAVKLSRQLHKPKRDNLVDAINYLAILAHVASSVPPRKS